MKAVILAGGFGTRLSEATNLIPKPMVEIGGKPILWHIMKTYSHYGINEFIICCGYKQYVIKEYFANYFRHNSDMTVDLSNNTTTILDNHSENWKVTMVDTGLNTQTGGLTAYKPGGKFGALQIDLDTNKVLSFQEKPDGDRNWINAGYFICEPEVFDYIPDNDDTVIFERSPLESIAQAGKMHAFRHIGFWKPMDTLRDNVELNEMWNNGEAPWKVW